MLILLVCIYFLVMFSGAIAVAAYWRGRSAGAWLFVALIASPIVAAAYLFALPSKLLAQNAKDPSGIEEVLKRHHAQT